MSGTNSQTIRSPTNIYTSNTTAATSSQQALKRQRIDPLELPPSKNPFTAAKNVLNLQLTSLPSALHPFITRFGNLFITQMNQSFMKQKTIRRMSEEDAPQPRSTHSNFTLNGTDLIKDQPEFKEINDEIERLKEEFSLALTKQIIKSAKLELKELLNLTIKSLIKMMIGITKYYFGYYSEKHKQQESSMLYLYLLENSIKKIEKIGDHFDIETLGSRAAFLELLTLPQDSIVNISHAIKSTIDPISQQIDKSFEIIVAPLIRCYFASTSARDKDLDGSKLLKSFELELAATDTLEIMDTEPTLDSTSIKKLVTSEIKQQLKNSHGASSRALPKKTDTKGKKAPPPASSSILTEKEKQKQKQQKQKQKQKQKEKADARNNEKRKEKSKKPPTKRPKNTKGTNT